MHLSYLISHLLFNGYIIFQKIRRRFGMTADEYGAFQQ